LSGFARSGRARNRAGTLRSSLLSGCREVLMFVSLLPLSGLAAGPTVTGPLPPEAEAGHGVRVGDVPDGPAAPAFQVHEGCRRVPGW
jgi:hypothetical protein